MPSNRKLYLNLYWHMHQPDYRDYLTGEYVLPWTYLHAIKDYTDMAYHLEQNPRARASFNFVPVLLDQLEDYAEQFAAGDIRDPLLALFLWHTRRIYRKLARQVAAEVSDYVASGMEVTTIVGVALIFVVRRFGAFDAL